MIDSHAHLTDERLRPEAEALVARARAAGVEAIVTIGTDLADSREAAALAARFPGVSAAVGIHPHQAGEARESDWEALRELAAQPGVVAVGETGLDYHYDHSPRDVQRTVFLRQLAWAAESGLPVVVHTRDADAEVTAILTDAGDEVTGVLHSFSGGTELLETALEIGWYVSFSGMVTFRNFAGAEHVRAVPADRIMVETDSPYLAPAPNRGKTNEPAWVAHVAARCAELRGELAAEFAARAAENSRRFYGLD